MATTTLPRTEVRRTNRNTPAPQADPVLPGLIIGPAYHLRDYPLDRGSIQIGSYGAVGSIGDGVQNGRPSSGAEALVVTSPPDNATGAILDRDSVRIFAESARVEILQGTAGTRSITSPDENLFTADSGVDLAAAGVRPGDQLVITYAAPNPDFVATRTVIELAGFNGSTLDANQCRVSVDISDPEFGGGTGTYFWRFERVVGTVEVPRAYISVPSLRPTVAGGVLLDVDLFADGGSASLPMAYGVLYMQYRSLRQDLSKYTVVTDVNELELVVGRVDERNPLAAALQVAFRHTDRSIAIYGTRSDNLNGVVNRESAYQRALDDVATRRDVYGIAPLTEDLGIIQLTKNRVDAFALPENAAYRRLFASHGPYATTRQVTANRAGVAEIVTGELFRLFASVDAGFASGGVAEDDVLYIPTGIGQQSYVVRKALDDDRVILKDGPGSLTQSVSWYYVLRGEGTVIANVGPGSALRVGGEDWFIPASKKASSANIGKALRVTRTGGPDNLVTNGSLLTIQDLRYDAATPGEDGNLITISYVDPASNSAALSVSVSGLDIEVSLATDGSGDITSTAAQIKAAIEAESDADDLVTATVAGVGSNVQAAVTATSMTGGRSNGRWLIVDVVAGVAARLVAYDLTYTSRVASSDGELISVANVDPSAINRPLSVSVTGQAIVVSLATDGSGAIDIAANSATNIAAAVQANAAANALVTVAIADGSGAVVQTTLGATNLTNSADPYYILVGEHHMPTYSSSAYQATIRDTLVAAVDPTSYTVRRQYRQLFAAGAAFITGAVALDVGDEVQIPAPAGPANSDYSAYLSSTAAQVLSDSRVILDVYDDLLTEDPEDAGTTQVVDHFRVIKPLSKQQQSEYLISIVQSFGSAWFSHVFPDRAEVVGINDAATGTSSPQPGYYMAVALMALCTALPVQQPLTRRALTGFGALSNSNYYFSPDQIEALSNNGYLVMVQDQPDSPPYVLHQITTDLNSPELTELSSMRCYDYMARRLKAVIDSYVGRVNITPEVIDLIAEAVASDISFVKNQKVDLIGAPITGGRVLSVIQSPSRADGVVVQVKLDFPIPFNNGLLTIEG